MDAQVHFPKCGLKQAAAQECGRCGLIFAKYHPDEDRPVGSSLKAIERRYSEPIGLGSRIVRFLFPLLAIGLGLLLATDGLLDQGFRGYVVLVGLGAVALYFGLSTFLDRISRNRYYTEAILFLVGLAALRLGLPNLFEEGTPPPPPAHHASGTLSPLTDLRAAVQALTKEARAHLRAGDSVGLARCCIEKGPVVLDRIERLSPPERLRARGLARAIEALSAEVARSDEGREGAEHRLLPLLDATEREIQAL